MLHVISIDCVSLFYCYLKNVILSVLFQSTVLKAYIYFYDLFSH